MDETPKENPTLPSRDTPEVGPPFGGPTSKSDAQELQRGSVPESRQSIRTLQSDIAETVRSKSLSIADIAIAQKKKDIQNIEMPADKHEKWSRRSLEVGAGVLVLAGLGALAFGLTKMQSDAPPAYTGNGTDVVSLDNLVTKDITGMPHSGVLKTINEFVRDPAAVPASIRGLVLIRAQLGTTTEPAVVTLPEFTEIIQTRAPGHLIRSLSPEMTLGSVGNIPFLAAHTTSYETAFEGMLAWESMMYADLPFIAREIPRPIIPPLVPDVTGTTTDTFATTTASTTPATTTTTTPPNEPDIPPPVWRDVVVKNKDARALMNTLGEIFLVYAFPRPDILVITQSKDALVSLFDRISAPTFSN